MKVVKADGKQATSRLNGNLNNKKPLSHFFKLFRKPTATSLQPPISYTNGN
jgi:hypothetical protein